MDLRISPFASPSPAAAPFEIVERKGLGHPDTICDELAEELGRALSAFYLERFGRILHHNVDKGLLWGGAARPAFGGGEITAPIELFIAGRATAEAQGVTVPVDALALETTRRWLREHLPALDAERHVTVHTLIRPSSPDLVDLFMRRREDEAALANDTSYGVGYAPLDDLERAVLAIERRLNAPETKRAHPEIGTDVKVMGTRQGGALGVTVACALVGRHVADLADYFAKKARIAELALAAAREASALPVELQVNAADGATAESVYLTVTGTSAEAGDDGQVGRGNRVNGLITPYRPMSLEAAAGKNPVSHVGKLYNIAAGRIAQALVAEFAGVIEAYCVLASRIGQPVDAPAFIDLKVRTAEPREFEALRPRIEERVREELRSIGSLWRRVIAGEFRVC
jgi:S-adenosylmethionine synthetase